MAFTFPDSTPFVEGFANLPHPACPEKPCAGVLLQPAENLLETHSFHCLKTHLHVSANLIMIFEFYVLYPQKVLASLRIQLLVSPVPSLTSVFLCNYQSLRFWKDILLKMLGLWKYMENFFFPR